VFGLLGSIVRLLLRWALLLGLGGAERALGGELGRFMGWVIKASGRLTWTFEGAVNECASGTVFSPGS